MVENKKSVDNVVCQNRKASFNYFFEDTYATGQSNLAFIIPGMGYIQIFMLIGLVVISMFYFISIFQADNNVDEKFIENSLMNQTFGDLQNSLGVLADSFVKNIIKITRPTIIKPAATITHQ